MSLDLNGDSDYLDSNEMDDSRTFNKANELQTRDVDSDTSVDYTLSHDAVGNLTDDDQYNEYVYDVWGRLRKVNNQTPDPVSEYRYNGLNWRISMQHDDDADGDLDSTDTMYSFVSDERWRPATASLHLRAWTPRTIASTFATPPGWRCAGSAGSSRTRSSAA